MASSHNLSSLKAEPPATAADEGAGGAVTVPTHASAGVGGGGGGSGGGGSDALVLTVKILSARNIRGAKGDKVNSFVRVQMADFDFVDSPVIIESPNPQYDFKWEQSFHVDETLIDTFANKRLSITLIESLPKEKTAVLGDSSLSMFPHFLKFPPRDPTRPDAPLHAPALSFRATAPIAYVNTRLLGKDADDPARIGPDLDVEVLISRPLVQPEVVEAGTFLTFRVDDVAPVPEEWSCKEGNEKDLNSNLYSYSLNFMLPAESAPERLISISNGSLLMSDTAINNDPSQMGPIPITVPKPNTSAAGTFNTTASDFPDAHGGAGVDGADSSGGGAGGGGALATPTGGPAGVAPGSDGAFPATAAADAANAAAAAAAPAAAAPPPPKAEKQGSSEPVKKVMWSPSPTPYLVWMPPTAVVRLREKIVRKEHVDVEFARTLLPRFAHLADTNAAKYRGRTTLDLSCLLFPRVMGVRGRWPIESSETGASGSGAGQSHPTTADPAKDMGAAAVGPGGESSAVGHTAGATATTTTTTATPGGKRKKDETPVTNIYRAAGTTVGLELLLEKPLLDKKKLQPITKSVSDFIPKRVIAPHLLFSKRSQRADEEYESQLQKVVRKLVWEFDSQFKAADNAGDAGLGADEAQRRRAFFFHLNKSGAYFEFKEQIKGAVVEVVRERFKRKSPFASQPEMHLFMSELYVHLTDKMHEVLTRTFRDRKRTSEPAASASAADDFHILKAWAADAEIDRWVAGAERWHSERVVRFEDSMQAWFDYGCFCLRNGMPDKGEECFKEILGRNPKHIPGLLAYGSYCSINERFEQARVLLVTAVELQPKYVMGLTILGLFYDVLGEEEESEIKLVEAQKVHKLSAAGSAESGAQSIFLSAAEFLIHCHAGQLAERALSQEILQSNATVLPKLLLSKLELQRSNFRLAEEHLQAALEVQQDHPDVWAALGHLQFLQKQWDAAKASYETVLTLSQEPNNVALVYTRLGSLYLRQKVADLASARMAKSMYLRACAAGPSAASWLGVGKACMAAEEWEEAEDALAEANVLNNRHADVWAYLALLNLQLKREFEGNQCIAQALRLGIRDAAVLRAVSDALMKAQQHTAAVECLRMCLEIEPDDASSRAAFVRLLQQASHGKDTSAEPANDVKKPSRDVGFAV
ncbi:Cilia- and flagella-associated protein 70 [Geranomyces michiganensis]|nr:Cilia- and flagella-associated protein 70 [Geranomyces michiganensis]